VTDNQPEENKPEGIEFDYSMTEEGQMHTGVIVRDPNKIRKCVSANIQWIPAMMGDEGTEYPGNEALEAVREELPVLPILVIGHMPAHMKPEDAAEHVEHQLFLVDDDTVTNLIGSGINMFTQDGQMTEQIMHMLFHILGGEHDEGTDCNVASPE
jgi:hypothetical protein